MFILIYFSMEEYTLTYGKKPFVNSNTAIYRVSLNTCGSGDIFAMQGYTYWHVIQTFLNWNIVTFSVLNVMDLFVTVLMKVIDCVDSRGA